MKKKILLFAMMVAMIACLFALCVSAESIKADSTSIDMTISFYDANNNEISKTMKVDELFNVSFKNDSEGYYFKLTGLKLWTVNIDGTDYSFKTQLAGLYFPEGITHMPDVSDGYWGFTAAKSENVRKVHLPESLQDLGGNFLRNIGHVKLVNEDGTFDNYLPESLVSVQDHLFCNWTLYNEVIYFPKGFHTIGNKTSTTWNFEGFSQVNSKITFVFLGKMTHIDFDTNEKYSKPTFIFAANEASDLWGYELPMVEGSTTKASLSSYTYNNDSTKNTLSIFWITKDGLNSSADAGTQTVTISSEALSLVFCGGDNVQYSKVIRFTTNATSYPALVDANGAALSTQGSNSYGATTWNHFYSSPIEYDMDAHATANKHYNDIVYQEVNCGYDETTTSTCVVCDLQSVVVGEKATGNHTYEDDFNCETALDCEVCKKTLQEAASHSLKAVAEYDNGVLAEGKKISTCENDGCKHSVTEKANPILVFTGIATKISDKVCGITFGYDIDEEALSLYEETHSQLKHGFVVGFASKLGDNAPIVNGEKADIDGCKFVMTENEYNNYSKMDFVLKANKAVWEDENAMVDGEVLAKAKLVLVGYVIDGESTTYFNYEASDKVNNLTYSYSEIPQA